MFVLYLIILFLLFRHMEIHRNGIYGNYIDKEQCNCIKGLFIVVVFCRHIAPYLADAGYDFSLPGDNVFLFIDSRMRQLLVVMFLFYSGYGVTESYKKNGRDYLDDIPRRRILPTLVNFDVAVLAFVIADLCVGIDYPMSKTFLAFTGWESIGNSNWYIFVILCCYGSTYLATRFLNTKSHNRVAFGGVIY